MAVIFITAALLAIIAALIFGTSLYCRVSLSVTGARVCLELRLLFDLIKLPISVNKKRRRKKSQAKRRYSAHKLLEIPKLKYLRVTARVGLEDAAATALLTGLAEC